MLPQTITSNLSQNKIAKTWEIPNKMHQRANIFQTRVGHALQPIFLGLGYIGNVHAFPTEFEISRCDRNVSSTIEDKLYEQIQNGKIATSLFAARWVT